MFFTRSKVDKERNFIHQDKMLLPHLKWSALVLMNLWILPPKELLIPSKQPKSYVHCQENRIFRFWWQRTYPTVLLDIVSPDFAGSRYHVTNLTKNIPQESWLNILHWFTNCDFWLASSCAVGFLGRIIGYKDIMSRQLALWEKTGKLLHGELVPPRRPLGPCKHPAAW